MRCKPGKILFQKQTAIDSVHYLQYVVVLKGVGALYTKHQMESLKGGNQEKVTKRNWYPFGIYAFADCFEKYAIGNAGF